MHISFLEIEEWEKDFLQKSLKDGELYFTSRKLEDEDPQNLQNSEIISPFIYSRFDQKILNKLPNLKLIATRSTGFDHIDLKACRERGILVANVPFYGENTVAEHTFALILALSRRLKESFERTSRGDFSLKGLRGFDLKGKTLGIVGVGHIGSHVARIAQGFELKVLAYDINEDPSLAKKLNFTYVPLKELLQRSDIVTLHVPYNKSTHYLINRQNINDFKRGSILINTARGGVVETAAIVWGLEQKILAGVGLDVLEEEVLIKEERQLLSKDLPKERLKNLLTNHILLKYKNVVITPHNAFNSHEALQRILQTTVENIKSFAEGRPQNLVQAED